MLWVKSNYWFINKEPYSFEHFTTTNLFCKILEAIQSDEDVPKLLMYEKVLYTFIKSF